MDRESFVLAALAPSKGQPYSPVQVQKLFFLLDKNIPERIGGPQFNFQPYNYGPFDSLVYATLERLSITGLVAISTDTQWRSYQLTPSGQEKGEVLLETFPSTVKSYIKSVSHFVRSVSFTELVTAIYKAYPEMRANSVFQD